MFRHAGHILEQVFCSSFMAVSGFVLYSRDYSREKERERVCVLFVCLTRHQAHKSDPDLMFQSRRMLFPVVIETIFRFFLFVSFCELFFLFLSISICLEN